jgi:4-amino-4-deoxy-L-arabinose transferase-like glycosyltransferase
MNIRLDVLGSQAVADTRADRAWWIGYAPIALILVLAFALRAAPNVWLELNEPGWHEAHLNEIEFYYDDVARSLLAGKGFVHSVDPRPSTSQFAFTPGTPFHFVPPLYAWLLAIEYAVFGPNVAAAKLVHCLLDAFGCLLIYAIGLRMADRRTALIAAGLYAVYPLALLTSMSLYYQTLLNLTLCWIVLCLAARVTVKNGMWTGIAVGLSALAKPVTLPLIALLPAVKMLEAVTRREPLRPAVGWSIALVTASCLTVAPWTVRNYMVFQRFIPVQSGAGSVLIQGSKEAYIDLDVDNLRRQYGPTFGVPPDRFASTAIQNHWTHATTAPLDYARFLTKKFFLAWYNTEGKEKNGRAFLVQLPFLLAALAGLVVSFALWTRVPNYYVLGAILYICLLQVLLFPLVRYTLAIMPLVMLPAGSAIDWALRRYNVRLGLHF